MTEAHVDRDMGSTAIQGEDSGTSLSASASLAAPYSPETVSSPVIWR